MSESLRRNLDVIVAIVVIITFLVGGVAWFIRLEDKTDQNAKLSEENKARIVVLEQSRATMDRQFGVLETKLDAIKNGVDELKRKP